jgi:hypothetical protein
LGLSGIVAHGRIIFDRESKVGKLKEIKLQKQSYYRSRQRSA